MSDQPEPSILFAFHSNKYESTYFKWWADDSFVALLPVPVRQTHYIHWYCGRSLSLRLLTYMLCRRRDVFFLLLNAMQLCSSLSFCGWSSTQCRGGRVWVEITELCRDVARWFRPITGRCMCLRMDVWMWQRCSRTDIWTISSTNGSYARVWLDGGCMHHADRVLQSSCWQLRIECRVHVAASCRYRRTDVWSRCGCDGGCFQGGSCIQDYKNICDVLVPQDSRL